HVMELLIIIDALRRSSARRITAVIPYFGYARQDRKPGPRTPISAKLVANLITRAGTDRVMTLDLHAGQIQGFFDIPTDNLYASPVMVRDIRERFKLDNVMVVSPDVGGVVRARGLAKRINAPLAIIDKRRERPGESEVMNVIGDVTGYTCVLVDDIVDSGGTLVNAADALLANKAKAVYAYISHGVLSGGAAKYIAGSRLKELVITDSIQPTKEILAAGNIRILEIASLIGEAIGRTAAEESVSSLFDCPIVGSVYGFYPPRFPPVILCGVILPQYWLWRVDSVRLRVTGKSGFMALDDAFGSGFRQVIVESLGDSFSPSRRPVPPASTCSPACRRSPPYCACGGVRFPSLHSAKRRRHVPDQLRGRASHQSPRRRGTAGHMQ